MLKAVEADLKIAATLPKPDSLEQLKSMIAHHMGWLDGQQAAGKRVRPLLMLLTCRATGGQWHTALPAASSIEIIHNFSLIHDDIEDDSETRRGRPTVWKLWGVPQAINTGDAMFALARASTKRLLDHGHPPEIVLQVEQALDQALLNLTLGQHLDLLFETQEDITVEGYLEMIDGKTAALLQASTAIGGMLSGCPADDIQKLADFGRHLGLAFQIRDDILGIWGDPEITGKPAGDDLLYGKKTLPVLFGLQNSDEFQVIWTGANRGAERLTDMIGELEACGAMDFAVEQANQHTQSALQTLKNVVPDGSANGELYSLANRLLSRER
jgi:geranylgeranyl diphosphate synthase type I